MLLLKGIKCVTTFCWVFWKSFGAGESFKWKFVSLKNALNLSRIEKCLKKFVTLYRNFHKLHVHNNELQILNSFRKKPSIFQSTRYFPRQTLKRKKCCFTQKQPSTFLFIRFQIVHSNYDKKRAFYLKVRISPSRISTLN
jgi:hypothetical protein